MSQCDVLLAALQRGEKLTVKIAMERYGVYALSQRMGTLRRQGHPIFAKIIDVGNSKRVAEYSMAVQKELELI